MTRPRFHTLTCTVLVLRVEPAQMQGDALAELLRDEFLAAYEQSGALHVIIDLGAVTYCSSAGIRPLLGLNRKVREHGGRLILCNLHPEIVGVLSITRLLGGSGGPSPGFESQLDVP